MSERSDFLFRVGTFNLSNLAVPGFEFYHQSYDRDTYYKKIDWIHGQLKQMNADIIGFQEVWQKEALLDAATRFDIFKDHRVVVSGENDKYPVVGLASRFEILHHESIEEFPSECSLLFEGIELPVKSFRRPVLKAVVRLPGGTDLTVFVVHLKSKRPDISNGNYNDLKERALGKTRSLVVRGLEAMALRMILLKEMKGNNKPVIVMGDLNDSTHSVTSEIIAGTYPKGMSRIEREDWWDQLLYSTVDFQTQRTHRDVYYTHKHEGHVEFLDHILISEEFWGRNAKAIGSVQYLRVFNDHLQDRSLGEGSTPRWKSDHAQVVVGIRLH